MDLKKARTVFMGTPEYSVPTLKMLIDNGFNIVCALTQTDKECGRGKKVQPTPVKEEAGRHMIPVLQPATLRSSDFEEELKRYCPQLFITIAYGKIIPENILNIPAYGCINVHASLLPKYRGPAPIYWAVINGEKKTGVTTMYSDIGIDTGDVLLKEEMPIDDEMTYGILHDRLSELSAVTLLDTLGLLMRGKISAVKQNGSEASYAPFIKKETGHIDWQTDPGNVANLVRGLNPYPCAYSFYQGVRMKILEAKKNLTAYSAAPGTIVNVEKDFFTVKCKDTGLMIYKIQMPDKKAMSVSEYLNGNQIAAGAVLE